MDKSKFSYYINKKILEHGLTEAKLAQAVGVGQKSINRYRNGETCPKEEVQNKIISYFRRLEEEGTKITILDDEKLYFEGDPAFYEGVPAFYDYDPAEEFDIYAGMEKLKYYTAAAQKHILRHFYAYWMLEDYEITFIDMVRELSKAAKEQLLHKMESMPVSLDMLLAGEWDMSWEVDTFHKLGYYVEILRSEEPYPRNWYTKTDEETGEQKEQLRKKNVERYMDLCEQLLYRDCSHGAYRIFDKVDRTIDYKSEEWYFLFLLCRMRLADEADRTCRRIYNEVEGHEMYEREYMIWCYVQVLKQK